ncbi:hypothetical protein BDR05DRAFT_800962 [Suillus weaverae]|nr:hypothetical protein BDR05DRAFT_800962 [Suillus weaverae]
MRTLPQEGQLQTSSEACGAHYSVRRYTYVADRGKPQGCSCAVHEEGSLSEATKYYTTVTDVQPKHVLGAIGMAQMQIQNDETAAAIIFFCRLQILNVPLKQWSCSLPSAHISVQVFRVQILPKKRLKLGKYSIVLSKLSSKTSLIHPMVTFRSTQPVISAMTWICMLKSHSFGKKSVSIGRHGSLRRR